MTQTGSDLPPQGESPDRPHKPADDREEIYYQGTPRLRGELMHALGWLLAAIALIVTGVLLWIYEIEWPVWWFKILLILAAPPFLLVPIIYTKTIHYRISNYRIDVERGILSKKIDTLELWHVDDISFRQSLLDRILNVGTITVVSNDSTTPHLPLRSLPAPRRVFDSLKQRIISVKRQRGVIKMDIG